MRKHTLVLTIAASMLTACGHGPPPMPTPTPKRNPPAALTEDCPDLPPPKSGQKTDLLANHVLVAKQYHKCRENKQGLVNWIKETKE